MIGDHIRSRKFYLVEQQHFYPPSISLLISFLDVSYLCPAAGANLSAFVPTTHHHHHSHSLLLTLLLDMATSLTKPADANLAALLRYFVGIDLIVETKHGRSFKGNLVSADQYMNLVLKNKQKEATTAAAADGQEVFDWVHIRGPTVRYIVFGANIDLAGVVKAGKDRERAASDKYRRGIRKAPK